MSPVDTKIGDSDIETQAMPHQEVRTLFIDHAVKTHWEGIVLHAGSAFVSAQQVLQALHSLNIRYRLDGQRLKKANAVGDALGLKGLNLPASSPPKRFYYLPAVNMTQQQLEIFHCLKPWEVAELAEQDFARLKEAKAQPDHTAVNSSQEPQEHTIKGDNQENLEAA